MPNFKENVIGETFLSFKVPFCQFDLVVAIFKIFILIDVKSPLG
jgi:hypothetical protein